MDIWTTEAKAKATGISQHFGHERKDSFKARVKASLSSGGGGTHAFKGGAGGWVSDELQDDGTPQAGESRVDYAQCPWRAKPGDLFPTRHPSRQRPWTRVFRPRLQ